MVRILFLVFILSVSGMQNLKAQVPAVEKVRDQFFELNKTENSALKLFQSLENAELDKSPVLLAYRGASCAAAAGNVNGALKKLEFFNKGKNELDKSAGMKPLDAEIRFLRLATQVNAPGFLGYSGDIEADKSIILLTLQNVPAVHPNAYLYQRICTFMSEKMKLSTSEKVLVNQLIVKFTQNK